jgi:amino acid transporter
MTSLKAAAQQPGDRRPPRRGATVAAQPPVRQCEIELPETLGYRLKRVLLGKPLVNDQLHEEKLSKPVALGVLAPDCISSSAYGTEQMLTQLLPYFGVAGFMLVMPITGVILALLVLLTLCYRDVVTHYTKAGGSYAVARENFGVRIAQIAAVALLIDYTVTVAVQISAGTDAIASWLTFTYNINIDSWKIWLSIGVVVLLCVGNLRGIREAGRAFAIPAYFYVAMAGITVIVGIAKLLVGSLPHANNLHDTGVYNLGTAGTGNLVAFASIAALLRGFANGGSSLTGLEAISNDVAAFRKPVGRNARTTMVWMSAFLGTLVLGISILAWQTHAMPYNSGNPTVLAQLTKLTWGHNAFGNVMLTLVQLATALILYTGGNTSFNGFPFLASFVAEDSFLPRQLTHRGHRLAFSNGIIVLTVVSLVLIIVTNGDLTQLVGLYAIGVFTGFTMAAAGMFKKHYVDRGGKGRSWRLVVDGSAAIASAMVVLIFAVFKFTEGAWVVVLVFPIGVYGLIKLNARYRNEAAALASAPASASLPMLSRSVVLVMVDSVDLAVIKALRYARSLRPAELRAVHLMIDSRHAEHLRKAWDSSRAADVPLEIVEVPDRRIRRAALELCARVAADGNAEVTVLLPRRTYSPIVGRMLHDRTADGMAQAVSKLPHVAAMIVPFDVVDAIEEQEAAERNRAHAAKAHAGTGRTPALSAAGARPRRATRKMLLSAEAPSHGEGRNQRSSEPVPIGNLEWRRRATVQGRVRSVYVGPVSGAPALECELYDETGGLTLVFLGRRQIPGIEPGAKMRVEGMVGEVEGYLAMTNPTYLLLPRDGDSDDDDEG